MHVASLALLSPFKLTKVMIVTFKVTKDTVMVLVLLAVRDHERYFSIHVKELQTNLKIFQLLKRTLN